MISKRSIFLLLLVLMPFLIAACSDTSSSLGQYHEGRILLLNVLEMDRTDELLYSTIDPQDVIRKWRIRPAKEGHELLLMRFKVENHVAVNAVVVADEQAAVIEGFFQDDYRPISVSGTVFLDQRGQGNGSVTLEAGECTDHARVVVNAGTNVQWTNAGDTGSAIQFGPGVLPDLGDKLIEIAPGGSVSHRFNQPGTFDYQCSGGDGPAQQAQILVEAADSVRGKKENNILFLEGSFNLPKDTSLDGWMIFEIPIGTKIRILRWRAGDSITIRF
ncbi:MAG: hypothetical protein IH872_10820 [Chloroflexi bacterium]|nr:hypothetical protein [Chloroflexota bacterium]